MLSNSRARSIGTDEQGTLCFTAVTEANSHARGCDFVRGEFFAKFNEFFKSSHQNTPQDHAVRVQGLLHHTCPRPTYIRKPTLARTTRTRRSSFAEKVLNLLGTQRIEPGTRPLASKRVDRTTGFQSGIERRR